MSRVLRCLSVALFFCYGVANNRIQSLEARLGIPRYQLKPQERIPAPDSFYSITDYVYVASSNDWLLADGSSCEIYFEQKLWKRKGEGPGRFEHIMSIDYDQENDEIAINGGKELTILNTHLIYRRTVKLPHLIVEGIAYRGKNLYFTWHIPRHTLLKMDQQGKVRETFEVREQPNFSKIASFLAWQIAVTKSNATYVVFPMSLNIVKLNPDFVPVSRFESRLPLFNPTLKTQMKSPLDFKSILVAQQQVEGSRLAVDCTYNEVNYMLLVLIQKQKNRPQELAVFTNDTKCIGILSLAANEEYCRVRSNDMGIFLLTRNRDRIDRYNLPQFSTGHR